MNPISFSVQGKHVLISGGCGGIGSTFAKAFLMHGARVTVTDLKPPQDDLINLNPAVTPPPRAGFAAATVAKVS